MEDYYYDYGDELYEDDNFYDEIPTQTLDDLVKTCAYPSIRQIADYSIHFLVWNIIFRLTTQTVKLPLNLKHIISMSCGGFILYFTLGWNSIYCIGFGLFTFLIICIPCPKSMEQRNVKGFVATGICLLFLIIGEWITGDSKLWHQIRGTQMIIVMKAISVAFDVESKRIDGNVSFWQYFGYIFCPANCVLGPWISITDYLSVYKSTKWNVRWIVWLFVHGSMSFIFLILSNCFIPAIIQKQSWQWLTAYRDAAAFRFSHYFISFLSQAVMITAGYNDDNGIGFIVTKPWTIEMPRSLVRVVVSWNIPMHVWLKTYVFRVMRQSYGSFVAVITTYVVSSLLHGINFQLAAVLLSLGIYTYVEYNLRKKLAQIYGACLLANECPSTGCSHHHKWNHPAVLMANGFFSLVAVVHLAYLGVMFEASTAVQEQGYSYSHTLDKWKQLNFASHWFVLLNYFLSILI